MTNDSALTHGSPRDTGGREIEIDLSALYDVVRRRRRQIELACLVCLAISLLFYLVTPNQYRSATLLQIERSNLTKLALDDLFQGVNAEYYETQHRLLQSRGLAEKVVKNLNLAEDPVFNPPRTSLLPWATRVPEAADDAALLGKLADRLLEGLSVSPVRRTHMVEVAYRASTPQLAARVANGVADAYMDWGAEQRSATVGRASAFLTAQVEPLKREIAEKEAQLQAYGRSSDIVTLDPDSNVILQRLQGLNRDYTAAVSERIQKEARHREFTTAPPEAIAETYAPGLIAQLRADQAKIERDYANKVTTYKPDWPAMLELKAQIDKGKQNLESVIAETVTKARDTARTEYQTALRREQSLVAEMERQKRDAMGLNAAAVEYNNLKVEVSTRRQLLDELLRKQSETGVASRMQGARDAEVFVVDRALKPLKRYRPSLLLNLATGLVLGLVFGVGGVFLVEYLDRTIKTPEEVARVLDLPLLATIMDSSGRAGYGYSSYGYGYGWRRSAGRPGPGKKAGAAEEIPIEMIPHTKPRLAISEAYRSFRTALLLSTAEGLKSVVITSAQSGEGKSSTVVNLAVVMAQLGRKTLVVDCDLRKPRLHQIFMVSNRAGLVDILTSGARLEDVCVVERLPKLSVIPAGTIPPNPAELLSSERMHQFVETATRGFDIVLFDSPPVLPVTDATLLGRLVDGAVLCLRAGVVTREDAVACRAKLRLSSVRLLGIVLNGFRAGHRDGSAGFYHDHEEYGALTEEKPAGTAA